MKRVLVLGSGRAAAPLVEELLRSDGGESLAVDVAAADDGAAALVGDRPYSRAFQVEVGSGDPRLAELVRGADAVVALLPEGLQGAVSRACLAARKPLVSTAPLPEDAAHLDAQAHTDGVLLLFECGQDPGLDHLSASTLLRGARADGARTLSLFSLSGGLPTPESRDNPWGYKVSWNPREMLETAARPVRYLEDGEVVESPSPFGAGRPLEVAVPGVGRLEAFPNRDAVRYRELYGLTRAQDLFRGTLRYPGWCESLKALADLGMLRTEPEDTRGATWADLLRRRAPGVDGFLRTRIAQLLDLPDDHSALGRLVWLGLFEDQPLPAVLTPRCSPLDAVAYRMHERLLYRSGEADLVVLEQRLVREDRRGRRQLLVQRIVDRGTALDATAMARTVSLPAALACRVLLQRGSGPGGVRIPTDAEIADPILAEMARRGVVIQREVAEA
jgi:saccharopine dehydrogenase-like NADP-dependent oxidoreductase